MIIHGGRPPTVPSSTATLDHRIAMTFAITAALADGETEILRCRMRQHLLSGFYQDLENLAH